MKVDENTVEIKVGIICVKNEKGEFEEKTYDIKRRVSKDSSIFTTEILESFAKMIANKIENELYFEEILQGKKKIDYDF